MRRRLAHIVAGVVLACWSSLCGMAIAQQSATPGTRSAAAVAPAANPTTGPTSKAARLHQRVGQAGCTRAECHAAIKSAAVLHGPTAANTCDACHTIVDPDAHIWELSRPGAELCTYCHEFDAGSMPVVHEPVRKGECLGCHDPHGSHTGSFLLENSIAELCGRCHDSVTRDQRHVHTPVAQGHCDSCHSPHGARHANLLDLSGPDMCLACHKRFDAQLSSAKFRHKAMDQGCETCHGVHGADQPMVLKQPVTELCTSACHEHEKIKTELAQVQYKHSVATQGRACVTCHTPHGGDLAKLMSDLPVKLCLNCHNRQITTADKRIVPAVAELADPKMIRHGAMKEGQCAGCHMPHGSDRPNFLAKAYSSGLYRRFAAQQFELCFSCHDPKIVEEPTATTLTGFRNGDRNLHFVHVDATDRGRNCTICHATHAARNDRAVRDTVLYKTWQMPIGFARTATGGTCAPGCHVPYDYDREHPVPATTQPTTRPRPTNFARLPQEKPAIIQWSGTDTQGRTLTIPDPAKPTLLVFLGADQDHNQQVLKLLADAATDAQPAQAVVVVCGAQAHEQVKAMLASNAAPWPLVSDPDCALPRQWAVRGWPTTLVVRPDGLVLTRLAGAPESLAVRLPTYIAMASGKTDASAAAQRSILKPQVINDGPATLGKRDLHMAETLLAEGKADQAWKVLDEALKRQPDSVPLRIAAVRALADLKRADALKLVDALPPNALGADQRDVLRARALLGLNRRSEAKALLNGVLQRNGSDREAHYVLGQIYELEANWPKAAAEYRAMHDAAKK